MRCHTRRCGLTIRSSRDRFAARLTRYRVPHRRAAAQSGLTQVLGCGRTGSQDQRSGLGQTFGKCAEKAAERSRTAAIVLARRHRGGSPSPVLTAPCSSSCAWRYIVVRPETCSATRNLTIRSSRHRFVASPLRLRYASAKLSPLRGAA